MNDEIENEHDIIVFTQDGIKIDHLYNDENQGLGCDQDLTIDDWVSDNHMLFLDLYYSLKQEVHLFQKLTYNQWVDYLIESNTFEPHDDIFPSFYFYSFYHQHKFLIDSLWIRLQSFHSLEQVCFAYFVELCYHSSYRENSTRF